jgi:hypothetical protein
MVASTIFLSFSFFELVFSFIDPPLKKETPFNTFSVPSEDIFNVKHIKFIKTKSLFNDKVFYYVNFDDNNNKFVLNKDKETLIFDVDITQYLNGFRYTKSNYNSNDSIVFLGCSFSFGDGINDDETLPYYISKELNFNTFILNAGITGRSTNTAISILESDIIDQFVKNKKIRFFVYSLIKDHIYRNFRSVDRVGDNKIYKNKKYTEISHPFGEIKKFFEKSYIFRKTFLNIIDKHNYNFYQNYLIDSIQYMNNIIKTKYNSKLIVIVWDEFDEDFMNKLKNTNLDLICLPKYFNSEEEGYRIKNDGHPTSKANKEISEILYNYIEKNYKFYK